MSDKNNILLRLFTFTCDDTKTKILRTRENSIKTIKFIVL